MSEWLQAFTLGSAAILTNACMLPLYPGLLAYLAGSAGDGRSSGVTRWLGGLVLAGVLVMMLLIGLLVGLLQQAFGDVLGLLLPIVYGIVLVLGVLLLLDRNPFAKLSLSQAPLLRNRYAGAFVYGLLLGPMTLPCTGPVIVSAFAVGAGGGATIDFGQIVYFFFFGLGFGWPLVLLPLLASPVQRQLTSWLAMHHTALNRAAGALLIAVAVFGVVTELLPVYFIGFEVTPVFWWVYWALVLAVIAAILYPAVRQGARPA